MLEALSLFQLKDVQTMPTAMEMYGQEVRLTKALHTIQCELTYTGVLEKFLSYVNKVEDVSRLLTAFSNIFAQFEEEFSQLGSGKGKGFF